MHMYYKVCLYRCVSQGAGELQGQLVKSVSCAELRDFAVAVCSFHIYEIYTYIISVVREHFYKNGKKLFIVQQPSKLAWFGCCKKSNTNIAVISSKTPHPQVYFHGTVRQNG